MAASRSTIDTELLLGGVLDEIIEQVAKGESPAIADYAKRYPELAEILQKTMPALLLMNKSSTDREPGVAMIGERSVIKPPRQLGEFTMFREIGRGGMGVVYEAEQISLERRVAIKILPLAALASENQLQRFKNEARAAASLHHPNIVPVYNVGCEQGVHYYAMQLIDGPSLASVIEGFRQDKRCPAATDQIPQAFDGAPSKEGRELDLTRRHEVVPDTHREIQAGITTVRSAAGDAYYRMVANWGIQAAQALSHAHENGILHRDIKPGNLLIDRTNDLWITDFGLARLESNASLTGTADVIGTLRYLPPELACGKRILVDHRADIYSLGLTLYELLTLRPAFSGTDREQLLRQIIHDRPLSPKKFDRFIPADLVTIIEKSIQKAPADRYASAEEFAADLQRVLDRHPILARRPSLLTHARRWSSRNQALVATALIAIFMTTSISTFAVWQSRAKVQKQNQALQITQQQMRKSLTVAREAVDQMYSNFAKDWLNDQPNLTMVQLDFLEKAASVFESLAILAPTDRELIDKAASSHVEFAIALDKLGLSDRAVPLYRRAIAFLEPFVDDSTTDGLEFQQRLCMAQGYLVQGLKYTEGIDQAEVQNAFRQAENGFRRLQQIAEHHPDEAGLYRRLVIAASNLRHLADDEQSKTKYLQEAKRALKRWEDHVGESEKDLRILSGMLREFAGEDLAILERSVNVARRLCKISSQREQQITLAEALLTLSEFHQNQRNYEAAESILKEALPITTGLVNDFPEVVAYRISKRFAHSLLAKQFRHQEKTDLAEKHIRACIRHGELVIQLVPKEPNHYWNRIHSMAILATTIHEVREQEAFELLCKATNLASRELLDNADRSRQAATYLELSPHIAMLGNCEGGIEATQLRVDELGNVLDLISPKSDTLSSIWHNYNRWQWQETEFAKTAHAECLRIIRVFVNDKLDDPTQVEGSDYLLMAMFGGVALGPFGTAAELQEAAELIERALQIRPDSVRLWEVYGELLYRQGRFDEALEWLTKYEEDGNRANLSLALTHLKLGNTDEARRYYELEKKRRRSKFNPLSRSTFHALKKATTAFDDQEFLTEIMSDRWPGPDHSMNRE